MSNIYYTSEAPVTCLHADSTSNTAIAERLISALEYFERLKFSGN